MWKRILNMFGKNSKDIWDLSLETSANLQGPNTYKILCLLMWKAVFKIILTLWNTLTHLL